MTREHLVSDSLFPEGVVEVEGFPWCKGEPKRIGMSGLTAKILCEKHNNDLSPVDDAGLAAFNVFKETTRLSAVREKMKPRRWNVVKHEIDGPLFERWLLKTLINISCDRGLPIGRDSMVEGRPSERLVRIAYGVEPFRNRAGLSFIVRTGMNMKPTYSVGFGPLIKNGHHIEAGLFRFYGQRILLFLEPEGVPIPLTGVYMDGEHLGDAQFNFHNETIGFKMGKFASQVVNIRWPKGQTQT